MTWLITLEPIGIVRSSVVDERDDDWGSVIATIELEVALAPGLDGIDAFSHALVVFAMHRATFDRERDLRRRPRGRGDLPELGIFAQRAKHRPNPIGVTAVEIVGVDGGALRVRGLDAIDGTPVLDIKPYVAAFDRRTATEPEWIAEIMRGYFAAD